MRLMVAPPKPPAMRGTEGDAMKSTLHKERATKSPKSRKWFFGPVKEEYVSSRDRGYPALLIWREQSGL
jgi:hypothetical protein